MLLQNDHTPRLPERQPGPPAAVWAPPQWRVMPHWQGALPLSPHSIDAVIAAFPSPVRDWVRHDPEQALVALVDGNPRPELTPQTFELEADAGQALLASYAQRGLSALRHAEGAWSLVLWEDESQQWLLAVDRLGRCPLWWRLADGQLQVRGGVARGAGGSGSGSGSSSDGDGGCGGADPHDDRTGWTQVAPGTHVRISVTGASAPAFHGSWRLERRDRRGWSMILGEFQARLTSTLHALEEFPAHLLLADDLAGGLLILQTLQGLGRLPAAVVWLEGWSGQDGLAARTDWQRACRHFRVPLVDAGAGVEADAGDGAGAGGDAGIAPEATISSLAGILASTESQPIALVSARSLEVLLPPAAGGWWQRCLQWHPWRADAPARPALHGALVVRAFSERWQPQLATALTAAALPGHAVWPLLDETVSHFLANLPEVLRGGTPWRTGFRAAVLASGLPREVNRLLP